MKTRVAAVILAMLLLVSATTAHAICFDRPCPYRFYYTVYTVEPDWCVYEDGDGLYMRFEGNAVTGWYVVHYYDHWTVPPAGFTYGWRFYVVNRPELGCGITPF